MLYRRLSAEISKIAPVLSGAIFCVFLSALASCEKKSGTADWDTPGGAPPPPLARPQAAETAAPVPAAAPAPAPPPKSAPTPAAVASDGLRFISYNLENWLTMDRYVDGKSLKGNPKPEKERAAAITLLARHQPDVLGLCEIGTREDLVEIQTRLKTAGIDLPHLQYSGGSDPVRHLGLLSRFPITSTAFPAETEFKLEGKSFSINRGILDATIEAKGKPYRFMGVHLKSKRDVEEGDQEGMRRGEARLVRKHVDSVLETDPAARLIVYGDFNDTRGSSSFKALVGNYNDPKYLTAIPFRDTVGTTWTHFWSFQEIYSRIDFVTVSGALKEEVDFDASRILDDPEWSDASDHRAVLTVLK